MDLSQIQSPSASDINRTELDSHADTCVAGANTIPLWFTDTKVNVSPFIGEYTPLTDVPIACVATAWDNPSDGRTVLLIINEALYFGDRMNHSLLCPNQLRHHGIVVNDTPRVFNPQSSHSIIIPGKLELPLMLNGIISLLETRKPTNDELDSCERIDLTSSAPWDPYSNKFQELEDSIAASRNSYALSTRCYNLNPPELIGDIFSQDDLLCRLVETIKIGSNLECSGHEYKTNRSAMGVSAKSKGSVVSKEDLALRWRIGLDAAEKTLAATTLTGRRFIDGPLERRLKTSQMHLRFPTLNMRIYTDTLVAKYKSVRGYLYCQVFTNGYGFVWCYPMAKKGDAHSALCQFIREVGIPKELFSD